GSYESPEQNPVFDINDFDETAPAPFEWDLKRLTTSIVLAGRDADIGQKRCVAAATRCAAAYRTHMAQLAEMHPVAAWRSRIALPAALATIEDVKVRG